MSFHRKNLFSCFVKLGMYKTVIYNLEIMEKVAILMG